MAEQSFNPFGGGLADILISAYRTAFPSAPAANLLYGGRQAYIGGKNQKLRFAMEQKGRQQIGQGLAQAFGNPDLENGYYGDISAIPYILQAQEGVNFGDTATREAKTGQFDTQGRYMSPEQVMALHKANSEGRERVMNMLGAKSNYQNAYDTGYDLYKNPPKKPGETNSPEGVTGGGQQPVIRGGLEAMAKPMQLPPGFNWHNYATDIPKEFAGAVKTGVEGTQKKVDQYQNQQEIDNLKEYRKALIEHQKAVYEATKAGLGGYGFGPRPAPQPSMAGLYSTLLESGQIQPQDILPGGSKDNFNSTVDALSKAAERAERAFGKGSPEAEEASKTLSDYISNPNSLQMKPLLTLPYDRKVSPFGNSGKQKLDNAGSSFAKWKQSKQ